MKTLIRALGAALAALCLLPACGHASVVIAGTRVVFDASQGEATVRLMNHGTRPALVEVWLDKGNIHSTPDSAHTPFLITPPVFRMNAHQDQSLRILYVGNKKALPTDRESLFWLNVLEVPPSPTGEAAHRNTLQFAIRSRIKLFYRPGHLPISRNKASGKLTWTTIGSGPDVALEVHNPTPYYITFSKVTLSVDGNAKAAKTGMVAPFSSLTLALPGLKQVPGAGAKVDYWTINDFGAVARHTGATKR